MCPRAALRFIFVILLCALYACGSGRDVPPATTAAATTTTTTRSSTFGVLLMAHGGTPEWNQMVLDAVKPLAGKYTIEVAFGMADAASLQEGARKLEARGVQKIGVVRLFVSGESWYERTEQIFGLRPGAPPPPPPPSSPQQPPSSSAEKDPHQGHHGGHSMELFRVTTNASFALSTQGLADSSEMGIILADRAAALSKDPSHEDVLILAHGPGDDAENDRWLAKLDARANTIRKRAPFRRVQVETLREDWPDKRVDAEKRIRAFVERASTEGGGKAIVIPFRVQGFGPYAKVLEKLDYVSDGTGLLPHIEVTRWIEREIVALQSGSFRKP